MTWVITGTVIFLFFIGSIIALWWWRLASKIAPYEDELRRRESKRPADTGEVIVISRSGEPRSKP